VRVEILDINDNAPFFPVVSTAVELSESSEPGTSFIIPAAEDMDSAKNSVKSYHIYPPTSFFDLSVRVVTSPAGHDDALDLGTAPPTQIRLVLRERVDRESVDHFRLLVVASDAGDPMRSGTLIVNVTVTDVNDNEPRFIRPGSDNLPTSGPVETRLPESASVGSAVYRVRAVDPDSGDYGRVRYELSAETRRDYGRLFDVDADTGQIFTRDRLDHETQATYVLYVVAADSDPANRKSSQQTGSFHSEPEVLAADRKSSQTSVVVRVDDVNDNAPTIRINTPARGSRGPEIVNGSDVGSFVAHVTVEDRDSGPNGRFHCRVTDNSRRSCVTDFSGLSSCPRLQSSLLLTDNSRAFDLRQLYDTEFKVVTLTRIVAAERVAFAVTCRDEGRPPLSSTLPVDVSVIGRNEHAPEFELTEYGFVVAENEQAGRVVGSVSAADGDDGPAGTVRYRVDTDGTNGEPCADVDPTTGAVATSMSFDRERAASCEIFVLESFWTTVSAVLRQWPQLTALRDLRASV